MNDNISGSTLMDMVFDSEDYTFGRFPDNSINHDVVYCRVCSTRSTVFAIRLEDLPSHSHG